MVPSLFDRNDFHGRYTSSLGSSVWNFLVANIKRNIFKSDLNPNSEKYEGVKYLIERLY